MLQNSCWPEFNINNGGDGERRTPRSHRTEEEDKMEAAVVELRDGKLIGEQDCCAESPPMGTDSSCS
ncbi:hypothetical protein EYF80_017468 [Liparis tanakae]|uniref:Uncharacterized protein n=1 Tax=Liparis tanakae TaxID=230148 RepID=A0A4Z2I2M8_9TELE|nr:hypothetical protein EYF80_017468 [Liparis tanakae]